MCLPKTIIMRAGKIGKYFAAQKAEWDFVRFLKGDGTAFDIPVSKLNEKVINKCLKPGIGHKFPENM